MENDYVTIPKDKLYEMIKNYGPVASKGDKYDKTAIEMKIDIKMYLEIFRKHFSYTIPDENLIKEMAKFIRKDKVLELGSGKGLHSYLLSLENIDIVATDSYTWNTPKFGYNFMKIEKFDYLDAINKYNDRSVLVMIWPPLYQKIEEYEKYNEEHEKKVIESNYSPDALRKFKGNKLIYIGEERTGCTACDEFFDILEEDWELVKKIQVNNIYGFDDSVYFYKKS